MKHRPHIVTIAGFDPSGGAGILADIKTIEALKCYGLAVNTANTIQTDTDFKSCQWTNETVLLEQLEMVLKRFDIAVAKIGIVERWETLLEVIEVLKKHHPKVKIVWDPVLSSSTNFEFHPVNSKEIVERVLDGVAIVTPNYKEIKQLFPEQSVAENIAKMRKYTNVYLKGGHRTDAIGKDELFTGDGKQYVLRAKMKGCTEKHGSGCVLSSAMAAYLALDFPMLKACYRAKRYTEKVLVSNTTLLGYHRI